MIVELRCRGLLFDLDGTLLDSLHAVDRAWTTWALRHGLDPIYVLTQIHGRRSIESIRSLLPDVDAQAEDLVIRQIEATDTHGVCPIPGAAEFLRALPQDRWGIVTSGTSDVALARMRATGLPVPRMCVFGEDVTYGKPHPEPYLLGASLLGIEASQVIGFEDTKAGLTSVLAAGMKAVAVGSSYDPSIYDFRQIEVRDENDEFVLKITSN